MKKILTYLLVLAFPYLLLSQTGEYNWFFGHNAGMTFLPDGMAPQCLTSGKLFTFEGCASISDNKGNLIFYTDGSSVYDRDHKLMPNGSGLYGSYSATQSALIVPAPKDSNIYYIFTVSATEDPLRHGLCYSIVDIRLNNRFGDVTTKNVTLNPYACEKLAGVSNRRRDGFWILAHDRESYRFTAYELTEAGVNKNPVENYMGEFYDTLNVDATGQMKFSPDGRYVALASLGNCIVEIFRFDNSTGRMSNPVILYDTSMYKIQFGNKVVLNPYGLEYSPNGKRLFCTFTIPACLMQFDIAGIDTATGPKYLSPIVAVDKNVIRPMQLQLAPNGNIYNAVFLSNYIASIRNPDLLYSSSYFNQDAVYLGGMESASGLPNFVRNVFGTLSVGISASSLSFCEGDSVKLTAVPDVPGNYTFLWSTGETTKEIFVRDSGVWSVTIFDELGTFGISDISISINPRPKAKISGNTVLCPGKSVVLSADTSDTLITSFYWSNKETTTSIELNSSGIYKLYVTNIYGCVDSAEVFVVNSTIPDVSIQIYGKSFLCRGDSSQLSASATDPRPLKCVWSTGEISNSITVSRPGTYSVTATDSCGNTDTCSITIDGIEFDAGIRILNGLCNGKSALLEAFPNSPEYTFQWNTGAKTKLLSVDSAGRYGVIVTYNNLCSDTAWVTILTLPDLKVTITGDTLLCPGSAAKLQVKQNFFSYKWSTGDTLRQISVNKAGVYSVEVTDSNGCTGTDFFTVTDFLLSYTGLNDIDFGKVKKASPVSRSLIFRNTSNSPVGLRRIYLKYGSSEFSVNTLPPLPAVLNMNSTLQIDIGFIANEYSDYADSLVLEIDYPCLNSISCYLFASSGTKTLIFLPDTSGTIGDDNFCIPLYAETQHAISDELAFSATISFDATLFLPDAVYSSYISGGDRYVRLSGNKIKFTGYKAKLSEFCGTILLADEDKIPLIISDFAWGDTAIEIQKQDGSLKLNGVCARNISRIKLISVSELIISPNPATDYIEITVPRRRGIKGVDYCIEIFNVFGEELLLSPAGGGEGGGTSSHYSTKIDISMLLSGVYFVRVGDKVGKFLKI